MIERYQIRYFLAVVDGGNFTRAAEQINISQPALSNGIGKLERELGVKLFLRNSQRVHLTAAGARFLATARTIERDFRGLELGEDPSGQPQLLRMGVLTTIPTRLLDGMVRRALDAPAGESIEIVDGNERELLGRLQSHRIDVALTIVRPGETRFEHERLYREGYSVMGRAGHPALQERVVAGESLAGETMIVRRHCEVLSETSRYFTDRGVRPRFSYRSTHEDRALAMVKAGMGLTVMPDSYGDPDLAQAKLAGFDRQRDVGLLFAEPATRGATSTLLDAVRQAGRRLAGQAAV